MTTKMLCSVVSSDRERRSVSDLLHSDVWLTAFDIMHHYLVLYSVQCCTCILKTTRGTIWKSLQRLLVTSHYEDFMHERLIRINPTVLEWPSLVTMLIVSGPLRRLLMTTNLLCSDRERRSVSDMLHSDVGLTSKSSYRIYRSLVPTETSALQAEVGNWWSEKLAKNRHISFDRRVFTTS